ncbi:alpha/beta hydrolase fold domain-containing protein [Variovorax humicola]|uniref:Alpha/beta hydrolase fold domain-containing protein n=1 Tax=Variovorax humicola TaxID=1769758 RepID=A0ABU8VZG7_9BURK
MARLKHKLSEPPTPPERGVKAATFKLLLDTAMDIIKESGHIPSVAEAAARSRVSRATAYRYFPSRSALVTAVIDSSLGPVRKLASDNPNGRERVHELFLQTFPRFKEFEAQLRAAAQLSLEQWGLERAGLLEEEPYRRGHRVRILEHAIEPLAPLMRPSVRDRLHHALSVVYGIEPYVILKDIWGLRDREVERTALWMADALIDAALRESGQPTQGARMPRATRRPPEWFDTQYNNRARIPGHPAILQHWADASASALQQPGWVLDLAYGDDPSERLDILPAQGPGAPVFVYIHGGYWRALDKRDHAFIAPPLVEAGATVVMLNYALCPAVSIEHIVLQLVQALAWVHRRASEHGGDPARIVVAGHSAGGHLATMLLACDWPTVAADLPADLVKSALSISGLYELESLRHTPFLAPDLGLSEASALRLSPAAMPAPSCGSLVTVVGGDESEEFHRQAALISGAWGPRVVIAAESETGRNHMNVLDELANPLSSTHRRALELLGLCHGNP